MSAIKSFNLNTALWRVILAAAVFGILLVIAFRVNAQTESCILTIDGSGTFSEGWDDTCLSEKDAPGGAGDRYARFYTFTLSSDGTFGATLTSEQDTYLYLLEGNGKNGTIKAENDDVSDSDRNSQIPVTNLEAGDYTIEATTYNPASSGDFTLVVEITGITVTPSPEPTPDQSPTAEPTPEPTSEPTPAPPPEPTVQPVPTPESTPASIISASNYHACSLDGEGKIDCRGRDDAGQVSGHPSLDGYIAISVGLLHSCALDEDGYAECWGSDEYGQATPAQGQFVTLASGSFYSCALREDGDLHCWGRLAPISAPTPEPTPVITPTPEPTPTPSPSPSTQVYTLRELEILEEQWGFSDPDVRLRVRGYVRSIGDDIGDLTLWLNDAGYREYCKFDERHRSAVIALSEEDLVAVDGTFNGFWLQDCELVTGITLDPVPPPAPEPPASSKVYTLQELEALEDDWVFSDPDIRLRVRAYVNSVRDDIGELTLWLRDAGRREYCYFDEAYRSGVTALSEGEQVTVDGTFNGLWLRDCVIVSRSGQGTGSSLLSPSELEDMLFQQEQDRMSFEAQRSIER